MNIRFISAKLRIFHFVAFALLAGSAIAAPATVTAAPGWQAGTGREKITPAEPIWMTGYGNRDHPAEGTAQDLWTKALAFADPSGNRGVLITADLCMISRESTNRVAAELEQKYRLPRGAVMFNVSHTHCGPWLEGVALGFRVPSEDLRHKPGRTPAISKKRWCRPRRPRWPAWHQRPSVGARIARVSP